MECIPLPVFWHLYIINLSLIQFLCPTTQNTENFIHLELSPFLLILYLALDNLPFRTPCPTSHSGHPAQPPIQDTLPNLPFRTPRPVPPRDTLRMLAPYQLKLHGLCIVLPRLCCEMFSAVSCCFLQMSRSCTNWALF